MLGLILRITGAVSGVVMSLAVTTTLPIEQAGHFFFAITIVTFLATVCSLGFNQTFVRFISPEASKKNWASANAIYSFGLKYCKLASGFIAILVFFITLMYSQIWGENNFSWTLFLVSPAIFSVTIYTLNAHALQALNKTNSSILLQSILTPCLTATIIFIYPNIYLYSASAAYVATTYLTLSVSYTFWKKHPWVNKESCTHLNLWQSSIPIWVGVIASQLMMWSNQIITGFFLSAQDVALLAISQKISMLVSFFLIVVNMVMAPKFATLYKEKSFNSLTQQVKLSTWLVIGLAIPTVTLVAYFSTSILSLFGDEYHYANHALRALLAGQLVNALTGAVWILLIVTGHEKLTKNIIITLGLSNLLLSTIIIPFFGIFGAAIVQSTLIAIQNIIAFLYVRKKLGFWAI